MLLVLEQQGEELGQSPTYAVIKALYCQGTAMKANLQRQRRNWWRDFQLQGRGKEGIALRAKEFALKSCVLNADGGLGPSHREQAGKA